MHANVIPTMTGSHLARRTFLIRSFGVAAVSASGPLFSTRAALAQAQSPNPSFRPLDQFIGDYMRAMNAPGLTLGLANSNGAVRTAGFGYSDVEAKVPVTPDLMFEIGSITKSFVALTLLQLRDEGKLDLHRPILEYLPWLPIEANYGIITVHHLLTHTSGLPDTLGLFLTNPQARHVQAFKPGEQFHYCNLGFTTLGYLIQKLDGRPWPDAVRTRIFEPLAMTSSAAVISNLNRARTAKSYVPFYDDRVYLRHGRLAPAGNMVFDDAAGSIISTPADMALYLSMLLKRGQGPRGRIVSEEGFALFSKPYIKAPEFSATASYGYGIAIDQLDGHTVLRHTGGMASFASSIHVDLDGGVAAFASINAMQGYRPVPVTQFAIQLMNAEAQHKPVPKTPELTDPAVVKNAQDYAGTYTSGDGRKVQVNANGDRLSIQTSSESIPLEAMGGDVFVAAHPDWQRFPVIFSRGEEKTEEKATDHANASPVVELMHGSDWYTNSKYSGPREFPAGPDLQCFVGHYHADSPWFGGVRIVLRKGRLWADGITPLQPLGAALFSLGDEPHNPDTAEFLYPVDGKTQMLKLNGADLWRIDTA